MSDIAPRLMTKADLLTYCSIAEGTLCAWILKGLLPKPLIGTHRWDRRAVDRVLNEHSGIPSAAADTAFERRRLRKNGNNQS